MGRGCRRQLCLALRTPSTITAAAAWGHSRVDSCQGLASRGYTGGHTGGHTGGYTGARPPLRQGLGNRPSVCTYLLKYLGKYL